jgi:hypothetical protein
MRAGFQDMADSRTFCPYLSHHAPEYARVSTLVTDQTQTRHALPTHSISAVSVSGENLAKRFRFPVLGCTTPNFSVRQCELDR